MVYTNLGTSFLFYAKYNSGPTFALCAAGKEILKEKEKGRPGTGALDLSRYRARPSHHTVVPQPTAPSSRARARAFARAWPPWAPLLDTERPPDCPCDRLLRRRPHPPWTQP